MSTIMEMAQTIRDEEAAALFVRLQENLAAAEYVRACERAAMDTMEIPVVAQLR